MQEGRKPQEGLWEGGRPQEGVWEASAWELQTLFHCLMCWTCVVSAGTHCFIFGALISHYATAVVILFTLFQLWPLGSIGTRVCVSDVTDIQGLGLFDSFWGVDTFSVSGLPTCSRLILDISGFCPRISHFPGALDSEGSAAGEGVRAQVAFDPGEPSHLQASSPCDILANSH